MAVFGKTFLMVGTENVKCSSGVSWLWRVRGMLEKLITKGSCVEEM